MAHRHERGAREAVTAAVGEKGRRTGAAMPRRGDIPLTQDGFEDPDAFFKSPAGASSKGKDRLQSSPSAGPVIRATYSQSQPHQGYPSSASKRHQRRPDVTHEIGVRGRKTGMAIAPNGRIARNSNGMEEMDAFFADSPASIPPLQRAKRISQLQEEQEDEEDEDDEGQDQSARYGARRRISDATSRDLGNELDEEQSYEEAEQGTPRALQEEEYDEEEGDSSRINVTGVSSVHQGRRQSGRSDIYTGEASVMEQDGYDAYMEDDGGTKTMSLEGSSFFNKSNRTLDAISTAYPSKSRLSTRSDVYDTVLSPSQLERSSPSTSSTPRQVRNAAASTSKQRLRALQDATSSDEENEAVQTSLTRSAQAARRRSGVQPGRRMAGQATSSPIYDRKGKGREDLFAPPSSDSHDRSRDDVQDQAPEQEVSDDDDGQGGFQPAYEDDGGVAVDQQDDLGYPDNDAQYHSDRRQDQADREQRQARNTGKRYEEESVDRDADEQEDDDTDDDQRDAYTVQPDEYEDEDEDSGNVSDELPPPLSNKGKQRDRAAANDSGHMEDEGEHSTRQVNGKSAKKHKQQQGQPPAEPRRKYQKRIVEHPDGVRRSRRDRTSPVAFWRNEHVIYQRIDSPSGAAYYEKVGIADRPKPPVRSLVHKQKRSRSVSRGPNKRAKTRSVSVATDNEDEGPGPATGTDQDWAKWDQETDPDGIVWDYVDGKELQRRIAFTSTMLDPKATKHGYRFQRVFTDGDFLGAGLLVIPPGEKKPLKPAKDNTYVLFCHQGAVRVLVHRTEFSVAKGGFFLIPRGNSYQINNLTDIDAVLVFMQAKEVESIVEAEEVE